MTEAITCCDCGIIFGVPEHWLRVRRDDQRRFFCPNGHGQSFTESTRDKLQRELDRAKQNAAYLESRIRDNKEWAQREQRSAVALRGQVTKLKKRAQAGTCPCCNRTFKQLAAHMADKHPAFKAEAMDDEKIVQLKRPA